jgi:hypothetical protein
VDPLTLQTSCFKLVLGVQHLPLGTGRPAFWGDGAAKARDARERATARVNFMIAVVVEVVVVDYELDDEIRK